MNTNLLSSIPALDLKIPKNLGASIHLFGPHSTEATASNFPF